MTQANIALDALGAAVTAIVLFNLLTERVERGHPRAYFAGMTASLLTILLTDLLDWYFDGNAQARTFLYISNTLNYFFGYLIIVFLIRYLRGFLQGGEKFIQAIIRFLDIFCAVMGVALLINLRTGMFFSIAGDGLYHRGEAYWLSQVFPAFALILSALITTRWPGLNRRERFVFGTYSFFPFIGILIDFFTAGLVLTYVGAFLSIVIIYVQIYVAQGKELAEKENELTHAQMNIMLSQIQPHFLYNVLNTIGYLCEKDPLAAKTAVDNFAAYLRGNLDSLKYMKPIPVKNELAHVRVYLALEKMRFDEELSIEWNIQSTNFLIPALTIQSLVENAVKHGVGKKAGGGTIKISSAEYPDRFEVVVCDDGVGYDTTLVKEDGRTHIGIDTVSRRLASMVKGTVKIHSEPGKGTVAGITIPKEGSTSCGSLRSTTKKLRWSGLFRLSRCPNRMR